jgi:hypothetical protein
MPLLRLGSRPQRKVGFTAALIEQRIKISGAVNDADYLNAILGWPVTDYVFAYRPKPEMRDKIVPNRSHCWISGQHPTCVFEPLDLAQCSAGFIERDILQYFVEVPS